MEKNLKNNKYVCVYVYVRVCVCVYICIAESLFCISETNTTL